MSQDRTDPSNSTLQRFSPQVEALLRKAGWQPGRIVPDSQLEKWLVIEWQTEPGFHFQTRMFSAAWRVLREFGGLVIEQNEPGVTCYRQTFIFDPLAAAQKTQPYNWPCSEWEADGTLFPVGYFEDSVVAIDGQGRLVDEDYSLLFGATIEEALENIIIGLMPEKLEVELWKCHEAATVFPMMRKRLGLI